VSKITVQVLGKTIREDHMRTVADSVVLVANVRSVNVMADRPFRLIPRGTWIRLLGVGSASGVRSRLLIGGQLIVDDAQMNLRATAPEEDKDVIVRTRAPVSGEILLTFLSAAADTVRWKVDIEP
jgi:hypothetical protein